MRRLLLVIACCCVVPSCGRGRDPRAWEVGTHQYGPLRYGADVAEVESAVGHTLLGITEERSDACEYAWLAAGVDSVALMIVGGQMVRVDVRRPGITTDRGVQVGDPAAIVHAVYGDRVSLEPHKYLDGEYMIVAADSTALVFETQGDTIINYRAGVLPEVRWVEGCS